MSSTLPVLAAAKIASSYEVISCATCSFRGGATKKNKPKPNRAVSVALAVSQILQVCKVYLISCSRTRFMWRGERTNFTWASIWRMASFCLYWILGASQHLSTNTKSRTSFISKCTFGHVVWKQAPCVAVIGCLVQIVVSNLLHVF